VFGYFPPLANPPAKRPMLTLLKQARAYGLGCVLATQNPVDLDYKGLSNAGTWFLGRLQTERDKARVIEGLEGASAQAGSTFNRQQMEATLAALGNRVFLMNNVHDDAPVVFHTRWAMSYLCGPLTRGQIKTLMDPVRAKYGTGAAAGGRSPTESPSADAPAARHRTSTASRASRPILPSSIRERFVAINDRVPDGYQLCYRPGLLGKGKVHFVRKPEGIDVWRECYVLQPINSAPPDDIWDGAQVNQSDISTEDLPDDRAQFADLPSELARDKSYAVFARHLKEHLYREESLTLYECGLLRETSRPGETVEEFRTRLAPLLELNLRTELEKLDKGYAAKLADAESQLHRARTRLSTQRWQFFSRLGGIAWVVVDTVMSAVGRGLPGRRRSIDPALRSVVTERGQQANAQVSVDKALQDIERLRQEHQEKRSSLEAVYQPTAVKIESTELKPQKGDIEVDQVSLVWLPWRIDAAGAAEPVY
jgi:hypothetical protein